MPKKLLKGKARGFKICRDKTFGPYFAFDLPSWATVIIVAINYGRGLVPLQLLLPHQFHVREARAIFKNNPQVQQITIIPASSEHYIDLYDWRT